MQTRIDYSDIYDLRQKLRKRLAELSSKVSEPSAAYKALRPYYRADKEAFYVLTLDTAGVITQVIEISVGILNKTIVGVREVFRAAIQVNASSVIIAHNHPSGSLEPSEDDKSITRRLVEAGKVIGIDVLDHIVFTDDTFVSLRELGEYF